MPFIAYKRGCVASVMNSVWRDRAHSKRGDMGMGLTGPAFLLTIR
jgi:hypothetical protein